MKIRHNILLAVLSGTLAVMATACGADEPFVPGDEPSSNQGKTYAMNFECGIDNYGDRSRADADYEWPDGAEVRIYENRESGSLIGRAVYSAENESWNLEDYDGVSRSNASCWLVYLEGVTLANAEYYDDIPNDATYIIVNNLNARYSGDATYTFANETMNLGGLLSPSSGRVRFACADPTINCEFNYGGGYYSIAENYTSTLWWHHTIILPDVWNTENGSEMYYTPYIYTDIVPRIKIGNMVYRYNYEEAKKGTIEPGQSVVINLPTENNYAPTWERAEYVSKTGSTTNVNIYPSSSTRMLFSGESLKSEIGFMIHLNYTWRPYSSSLSQISGKPNGFYFCISTPEGQITYGEGEEDDINFFGIVSLGGYTTDWETLMNRTEINSAWLYAPNYDVYVKVNQYDIANF